MDPHCTRVGLPVILVVMVFSCACSATAKDDTCTKQLVGLATCLPYVGGNAKAPTPDCCSGLKQVLKTNKTCLCVIIKDRNDPELGLSINVTLALGLPSVCNAPANVSECPTLLHLAPNSPDAQVFYQFGHGSNTSASSPVASVQPNATSASGTTGATGQVMNDGHCSRKRWLGLEVIIGGVLQCFFTSHLFI